MNAEIKTCPYILYINVSEIIISTVDTDITDIISDVRIIETLFRNVFYMDLFH